MFERDFSRIILTAIALILGSITPSLAACNRIQSGSGQCVPNHAGAAVAIDGAVGVTNPLHTVTRIRLFKNGVKCGDDLINPLITGSGLITGCNGTFVNIYNYGFQKFGFFGHQTNDFQTEALLNTGQTVLSNVVTISTWCF